MSGRNWRVVAVATVLGVLLGRPSAGQVTVGVTSSGGSGGSAVSTLTWSHTVGSGTDRLLLVPFACNSPFAPTVTSVTFGGVGLTSSGSIATNGNRRAYLYYLIAPAVSTANIVITMSDLCGSLGGGGLSVTDGHQTTPLSGVTTATGSSTQASVTVTCATDNLVVDAVLHALAITVGTGQTAVFDTDPGDGTGGSYEAGAASVTMTWDTAGGSNAWAILGACVEQATGGGAASPRLSLLGMGR